MLFSRRRYYFWLVRAYIKKWKKTIFASVVIGVVACISVIVLVSLYIIPLLDKKTIKVGYAGVYTADTLPANILTLVSYGLTRVSDDGVVHPRAASGWQIKNNSKSYLFNIKPKQFFQNGQELTTKNLPLNFSDVKRKNINDYTVEYDLKSPYAPFLLTTEKPLFINSFIGLGSYRLQNINLNAGFVQSISLQNIHDATVRQNISFYPTQDALKLAFALGDINDAENVTSLSFKNGSFTDWHTIKITKQVHYDELVTLFYNNNDSDLSDKKIREALNYALPDSFPNSVRAYSPISPLSPYYVKDPTFTLSSIDIAKTTLDSSTDKFKGPLIISTTEDFVPTAKIVQKAWKQLGITSTIKVVDGIPNNFQVFLYKFQMNKDPDQYTLWHSDASNNITGYKNLRIDKLLEDGRQTTDTAARIKIYADFQKYLLDDAPASFLYFPVEYSLKR